MRWLQPGGQKANPPRSDQRRSDSTFCGFWLARDNTFVPDWTRIWARVSLADSWAKSASRMLLSASCKLATVSFKLNMLLSKVIAWNAPSRPRRLVTWSIDSVTILAALLGSTARAAEPPLPSWNIFPLAPPKRAVLTLLIQFRAC